MSTKSKKIRNARVIATDIFMLIAVLAIVFLMMLIAMGYKFTDDGGIEQSGLLEISSQPSSAKVTIDGDELFSPTEISKLLSTGSHDVKLTKNGYDVWKSQVEIEAGLLTKITWARLFPINPTVTTVDTHDKPLTITSFSPSRKNLIVAEADSDSLELINIQQDKLKAKTIKFSDFAYIPSENNDFKIQSSDFKVVSWSNNDSKVLVSQQVGESNYWIIVNLADIKKSINLTETFSKNFTQLLLANDSASKIWALADGELTEINIENKTMTQVIAKNVTRIANNQNTIAYVAKSSEPILGAKTETETTSDGDTATNKIFVYNEGEDGATAIVELGDDSSPLITMGTYWSKNWLAYTHSGDFHCMSGKYPSYNKSQESDFKDIYKTAINFEPSYITNNPEQRVIITASNKRLLGFDIETLRPYNFEVDADLTNINWLDNYLIWNQEADKIIAHDFTGENRRELASTTLSNNSPAVISENNQYFYYFTTEESPIQSSDQTTNSEQSENSSSESANNSTEQTTTQVNYVLKREKLNI